MKNRNKYAFIFSHTVAVILLLLTSGCSENSWDDHYKQIDERLEVNLLEVLSQDSELTKFVALLKQTELDKLLAYSQAYTVWAPSNAAIDALPAETLNDPELLKRLLENHISKFSYSSNIIEESVLVKMLNDKYIAFAKSGTEVSFGGVAILEKDVLASNGVLHKVNGILNVSPNIWGYLNENETEFITMMTYLNQFNETVFDEANSVKIGSNSLGQAVYDSLYVSSNTHFNVVGNLNSEEERFTTIGISDMAYTASYNMLKDYYQYPVEDSVKNNTDKAIFNNFNFPAILPADLGGVITTTTGNSVMLAPENIVEDIPLSNGNLLVVSDLGFDAKDVIFKPVRYEVENPERRVIGSLTDLTIKKKYNVNASGEFINTVDLLENPNGNNSNNYFEIAFPNVLSAAYTVNIKFHPIGASQDTKLKFEFSYKDLSGTTIKHEIPSMVISNLLEDVMQIGDTYTIPVYVNNAQSNSYFVKLKVIVDISEPELLLYDRKFGIDYVELIPAE
ncbi:fasciclin domain-containing protein [Flavicella sediminum]|uniref:fasciclin domain-containing protein n=1 Tax=Flavicella sediminum TaxID=2585141 RepID=UPI0011200720|nr:fasciclin domain-containing protein [Flavicella sediminum]